MRLVRKKSLFDEMMGEIMTYKLVECPIAVVLLLFDLN